MSSVNTRPVWDHRTSTLIDVVRWRAVSQSQRLAYGFLADGEQERTRLTYGELDRQARAIASKLQAVAKPGDRALLLLVGGEDFIPAFLGCLFAGVVAVPAYPPDPARLGRTLPRVRAIVDDASPTVALISSSFLSLAEDLGSRFPDLRRVAWIASDALELGIEDSWKEPRLTEDSLAFLQYTSGSTARPKGVMVSHGNLIHNQLMIRAAMEHTDESTFVSWLPLYHDMGLIGTTLQPLFIGAPSYIMSPLAFLQKPVRWLKAITRYKAATSGGPNFAYDLCVKRVSAAERAELDLSSWSVAFNGAEPVRRDTIDRFCENFASSGFRPEAFFPCYGLAEATLIVAGSAKKKTAVYLDVSAGPLGDNIALSASERPEKKILALVSSGHTVLDQSVLVVDPETCTLCDDGIVGEVWVEGPSVALGYWKRPQDSDETFDGRLNGNAGKRFLRTGDLGFLKDGELFITGRRKDLIIIRGRNHYPQDIETTVERSHPALRPGCGAAFSIDVQGEERLVVIQEVDTRGEIDPSFLFEIVKQNVSQEHELQLHAIALIQPGAILKTSSGKIQRRACRDAFLKGEIETIASLENDGRAGHEPIVAEASSRAVNDVESRLISIFAEKLHLDPKSVEVDQPIARYGIDSLQAVDLKQEIETVFGVDVPMGSLFGSATIRQLAELAAEQSNASVSEGLAVPPVGAGASEFPLSRGQQAIWFLHQLAPTSAAYNLAGAATVRSNLDLNALDRALSHLVERHDALRTTFVAREGEPFQRTNERGTAVLPVEDAAEWHPERLDDRLAAESLEPIDLQTGPLIRLRLFKHAKDHYTLLIVVHHIVADFWSLGIVLEELGALYEREIGAGSGELPAAPGRYVDYVEWQTRMLESAGGRLWEYWRRQLEGELPTLTLPQDRSRPPVQSYAGSSYQFRFDREATGQMKGLARGHDATLFVVLLAGFQALLNRYSGQDGFLIGVPTAGRSRREFRSTVGYFANPVVLRANLSGDLTFSDHLLRARESAISAFEHQDYPFPLLVERIQPHRDSSRSPLFQVMFVLQQAPEGREGLASLALGEKGAVLDLGAIRLESIALQQRVAQFDLVLMMAEVGGGISASLQYNTDLFDRPTIARLAGHLETLMAAAVLRPGASLKQLPLLTEVEERELIHWNDTAAGFPAELCIPDLFETQASLVPDAIALVAPGCRITYSDLNSRANQLASYLRELGVGSEVCVGVCLSRSIEMVIALLATLKAGGAYVPMDPSYPKERLAFTLYDSDAAVLITEERLLELLPKSKSRVICVDEAWKAAAARSVENPVHSLTPENLAYVIYTSGSTGKPKGVAIRHDSAVAFLQWSRQQFTAEELDGVLASTSICFDLSVFELFAPLCWGGKIILAENALSLKTLSDAPEVRLINTVPSAVAEVVRSGDMPGATATVNLAGEPLQSALVQRVYECPSIERVYNLYGPTEDTTYSTFALVGRSSDYGVPIGRPISNSRAYLLDAHFQRVPVGVTGELYLAGQGLARGYLNRPDLTAGRFLADAVSTIPGDRMYRTGDLGRYRPDGSIDFLGRSDTQIKLRGFRIELGEIEAVLSEHPAVRENVVVLHETGKGDKLLAAYLAPSAGAEISQGDLRNYLKTRLPAHMAPSVFVTLDALPLTPNGKIDRRRLPAPLLDHPADEQTNAFRSPVEEILGAIWSEVLGVEGFGPTGNFFELGGHSLLATRIFSRVSDAFQVELPVHTLFESPTIAGLAAHIESSMKREAAGNRIERLPRREPAALSPAQQRLWFLYRLAPESPVYNVPLAISFKGVLNLRALERAIGEIVRRHDVLRSAFVTVKGEPVQALQSNGSLTLPVTDLTLLAEGERREEAAGTLDEEARKPFDLSDGRPVRLKLLRLGRHEHVLLVVMHHIVSDGWSIEVFLRELASLYDSFVTRTPSRLPELPIQYADFAAWQHRWLQSDAPQGLVTYWRQALAGVSAMLEVPADRPRPAVQTFAGSVQRFRFSSAVTAALKNLSRREGVTLFMTAAALVDILLQRYTRQDDLVIGAPAANRAAIETEPLIGFFSNMLPLRVDLSGDPFFVDLLKRVRDVTLAAYAHQELPIEMLIDELGLSKSLAYNPLFQVALILQKDPLQTVEYPGLSSSLMPIHTGTAKFDLLFSFWDTKEELTGEIEYSTDLFDPATIARMAMHLVELAESVAAGAEQPISRFALLGPAERRAVLDECRRKTVHKSEGCLHEMFEGIAERFATKIALVLGESRLTYQELNTRSNQLANYLIRIGVGQEDRVAICAERSVEMVTAILATLKTGACYVPLDPAYPIQRLEYIIGDSKPLVTITAGVSRDRLPVSASSIVDIESDWSLVAGESSENLEKRVVEQNAAYVIYTSGSTGAPKGVVVTHRNVSRLLAATDEWFGFNEHDVWALFHSYAFDFSVWEMWGALARGGRLVVAPSLTARSPEAFRDLVVGEEVTVLNQTPSAFRQFIKADDSAGGKDLALRVVIFGGEALEPAALRSWTERHGDKRPELINMYGITETTVHASCRRILSADVDHSAGSRIGRPISDLDLFVLDAGLEPLPIGVPGELYVGGEGIARGYLDRPDLTAQRFLPNPFSETPGERLYFSGDIARIATPGDIEYRGRSDDQVKIRGYRIELREIESVLMNHPDVLECAILSRNTSPEEHQLVCYVVARHDSEPTVTALLDFLRERLPDYMIPSSCVFMRSLPLTVNGKVDRRALPEPEQNRPDLGVSYIEPGSEVERVVAGIWRELFKLDRIGVSDSFFDLGGNSLLATQLIAQVKDEFEIDLPLQHLFERPTIRAVAAAIENALLRKIESLSDKEAEALFNS